MNIKEKFLSTLSKARRSAASAAAKASLTERERERGSSRADAARHRGIMRQQNQRETEIEMAGASCGGSKLREMTAAGRTQQLARSERERERERAQRAAPPQQKKGQGLPGLIPTPTQRMIKISPESIGRPQIRVRKSCRSHKWGIAFPFFFVSSASASSRSRRIAAAPADRMTMVKMIFVYLV